MPKLQRWLVATKVIDVIEPGTLEEIESLGGHVGGGWGEVHQHVCVNRDNKEAIERLLTEKGFRVTIPSDHSVYHPDYHKYHDQEV